MMRYDRELRLGSQISPMHITDRLGKPPGNTCYAFVSESLVCTFYTCLTISVWVLGTWEIAKDVESGGGGMAEGGLNGDHKLDRTFAGGFLDKNVHAVSRCAETKNQKKSARRAA